MLNALITEKWLLEQIMIELQHRYAKLNLHYEAAFTDSFCTRRCCHTHQTLIEAAMCATLKGAGWYVIGVQDDGVLARANAGRKPTREQV